MNEKPNILNNNPGDDTHSLSSIINEKRPTSKQISKKFWKPRKTRHYELTERKIQVTRREVESDWHQTTFSKIGGKNTTEQDLQL